MQNTCDKIRSERGDRRAPAACYWNWSSLAEKPNSKSQIRPEPFATNIKAKKELILEGKQQIMYIINSMKCAILNLKIRTVNKVRNDLFKKKKRSATALKNLTLNINQKIQKIDKLNGVLKLALIYRMSL